MTRGIFSPESISQAVQQTLASEPIPDNHHGAFVIVATTDGIQAAVATRINDTWQVEAFGKVSKPDGFTGGVKVQASW